MHGISKSKHEHLMDALLQLENLLLMETTAHTEVTDPETGTQEMESTYKSVKKTRAELEELFSTYNVALGSLATMIQRYEELYNYSRVEYLAKVLKELRRRANPADDQFKLMKENIQTVYRT
ncbi:hypothetical protein [Mucilaginibacter limnophilus]|uniref:hypothetical protein n=1 Tax=Mucilaginibacter limnophilus TaxID=1932778 RepID=UPI00197BC3B4|nr:hypothetical protein [Mucilaginibacter limnophilus]